MATARPNSEVDAHGEGNIRGHEAIQMLIDLVDPGILEQEPLPGGLSGAGVVL